MENLEYIRVKLYTSQIDEASEDLGKFGWKKTSKNLIYATSRNFDVRYHSAKKGTVPLKDYFVVAEFVRDLESPNHIRLEDYWNKYKRATNEEYSFTPSKSGHGAFFGVGIAFDFFAFVMFMVALQNMNIYKTDIEPLFGIAGFFLIIGAVFLTIGGAIKKSWKTSNEEKQKNYKKNVENRRNTLRRILDDVVYSQVMFEENNKANEEMNNNCSAIIESAPILTNSVINETKEEILDTRKIEEKVENTPRVEEPIVNKTVESLPEIKTEIEIEEVEVPNELVTPVAPINTISLETPAAPAVPVDFNRNSAPRQVQPLHRPQPARSGPSQKLGPSTSSRTTLNGPTQVLETATLINADTDNK